MRTQFLTLALLAGTVAACANNNPPPPPPMAPAADATPAPAPAAAATTVAAGRYRGTSDTTDLPRGCRKMGAGTAMVRGNNTFTFMGARGMIGPDGTITGRGLSGSATSAGLDLTYTRGKCTYHYMLTSGT